VLLLYLPLTIANASDIGNSLNYFADTLLYGGGVLVLAGALTKETPLKSSRVTGAFAMRLGVTHSSLQPIHVRWTWAAAPATQSANASPRACCNRMIRAPPA